MVMAIARDGHAAAVPALRSVSPMRPPYCTPGCKTANAPILRPFSGNSSTPRVFTTWPKVLDPCQQSALAADFHGLDRGADLQVEVDARLQVQLELYAGVGLRLEARRLDGDGVQAGIEKRKIVVAAAGRGVLALDARLHLQQRYLGSHDYRAAGIDTVPRMAVELV